MSDLSAGIWNELQDQTVQVNTYRRNVQRAFLEVVDDRLHPNEEDLNSNFNPAAAPWTSDIRAVLRAELEDIDLLAEQALARTSQDMTRIHLRDVRSEIQRILGGNGN